MHSLCSKFHIPQISASATDPEFLFNRVRYNYLLRMSPSDLKMNLAMKDLIKHFKWERMGILTSATVYGKTLYGFHQNCDNKPSFWWTYFWSGKGLLL